MGPRAFAKGRGGAIMALRSGWIHSIVPNMTARLTLDKAGRIVLPKPLRDELRLGPGDTLEPENAGERITLRPVRSAVPLA